MLPLYTFYTNFYTNLELSWSHGWFGCLLKSVLLQNWPVLLLLQFRIIRNCRSNSIFLGIKAFQAIKHTSVQLTAAFNLFLFIYVYLPGPSAADTSTDNAPVSADCCSDYASWWWSIHRSSWSIMLHDAVQSCVLHLTRIPASPCRCWRTWKTGSTALWVSEAFDTRGFDALFRVVGHVGNPSAGLRQSSNNFFCICCFSFIFFTMYLDKPL